MAALHRRPRRRLSLYEPPIEQPAPAPAPVEPTPLPPLDVWALIGPLAPIAAFLFVLHYTHNALAAAIVAVALLVCVCAVGSKGK